MTTDCLPPLVGWSQTQAGVLVVEYARARTQLGALGRNHKARGCLLVFRSTPKAWVAVMDNGYSSDSVVVALGVPCRCHGQGQYLGGDAETWSQSRASTADSTRPFVDEGGDQTINTILTCKGL